MTPTDDPGDHPVVIALHHVQVSAPAGCEAAARAFWADVLGLAEVEKPADLQARGGCWFRAYDEDRVGAEVHVGVEADFTPAGKAHPALVVADLDAVADALVAAGHPVDLSQRGTFPGYERLHTADPFGNRVEILAALPRAAGPAGASRPPARRSVASGEQSPVGLPAGPA